jgi:hypothetical protein
MGEFVANLAMLPGEGAVRLKILADAAPNQSSLPRGRCASKHACAGSQGGSRSGKLNNVTMQSGGFII